MEWVENNCFLGKDIKKEDASLFERYSSIKYFLNVFQSQLSKITFRIICISLFMPIFLNGMFTTYTNMLADCNEYSFFGFLHNKSCKDLLSTVS